MCRNEYLKACLEVLATQKDIAYEELSSIDTNVEEQVQEIDAWHREVADFVNKSPPTYHVRSMVIYENELNQVMRINYIYFTSIDSVVPPSIIIKCPI